jgi:hypothetical protein
MGSFTVSQMVFLGAINLHQDNIAGILCFLQYIKPHDPFFKDAFAGIFPGCLHKFTQEFRFNGYLNQYDMHNHAPNGISSILVYFPIESVTSKQGTDYNYSW